MTGAAARMDILVIDDDKQNVSQYRQLWEGKVGDFNVAWDFREDFDEAVGLLDYRRYDLVVCDVYVKPPGAAHSQFRDDQNRAKDVIRTIREKRFCPVVAFSTGPKPLDLEDLPFVRFVDKTAANDGDKLLMEAIADALGTGIPAAAKNLHDALDRSGGSYLWDFLSKNWEKLDRRTPGSLERIIRRRAALMLERVREDGGEVEEVAAADCYVYPPLDKNSLRLGEVIRNKSNGELRVVLTPHCHLVTQPKKDGPKAENILTVKARPATEVLKDIAWSPDEEKRRKQVAGIIKFHDDRGTLGIPEGRYFFVPGFLDIPDSYCDLLQLESVPYAELKAGYDRLAVLDSPFAEALQAALMRLYSNVGLPSLRPEDFLRLCTRPGDGPEQPG